MICSRKDVKQLLKDGVVVSNGKKIKSSGAHVDPEKDDIYVDGNDLTGLSTAVLHDRQIFK